MLQSIFAHVVWLLKSKMTQLNPSISTSLNSLAKSPTSVTIYLSNYFYISWWSPAIEGLYLKACRGTSLYKPKAIQISLDRSFSNSKSAYLQSLRAVSEHSISKHRESLQINIQALSIIQIKELFSLWARAWQDVSLFAWFCVLYDFWQNEN